MIEYDRVKWGITSCQVAGCGRDADAWVEPFGPICLECADRYVTDFLPARALGFEGWFYMFDDGEPMPRLARRERSRAPRRAPCSTLVCRYPELSRRAGAGPESVR